MLVSFIFLPSALRPNSGPLHFRPPTTPMKKTGKCPKCGSTEIIADARVIDRGAGNQEQEFCVATFGKPEAIIFKDKHSSIVSAWVCQQCGYIEFYADSPAALKLPKA